MAMTNGAREVLWLAGMAALAALMGMGLASVAQIAEWVLGSPMAAWLPQGAWLHVAGFAAGLGLIIAAWAGTAGVRGVIRRHRNIRARERRMG